MSTEDSSDQGPSLLDLQGVVEESRKQLREDLRELKATRGPGEGLRIRQEMHDLFVLRMHARGEPSDWLQLLLGPLPDRFRPSERQATEALRRLARRWAGEWKKFDPWVNEALVMRARQAGVPVEEKEREVLEAAIFEALHDARKPQVTQISRNRAMRLGSKLVLLQERDLKQLAQDGLSPRLVEKLRRRPAGLHVFPPYQLLSPIQALLAGYGLRKVRPTDLRPHLFHHWARRRAFSRAEDNLLLEAGLDRPDWDEVEVIEPGDEKHQPEGGREQVYELELLEALDQDSLEPLRAILDRKDLAGVLEATSPSQEEILLLLRKHLALGFSLTGAKKEVAEIQGVTRNRIDVALSKVRKRVKDPR